ncbi:MAG: T9SS type A sorting domain-containing protein [Aequorivita sp.]
MKQILLYISLTIATFSLQGQTTKKVLFLGNSYTSANNLPLMVNNMANSSGDVLIYDSNTPGGYRLRDHLNNPTSLDKLNSNSWDYVALQGQSQETSMSQLDMETQLYPFAQALTSAIRANYGCSQPLFYMTWGRKNGDVANCPIRPWVCTYEEMDDVIKATYIFMSESNEAELAPAGAVWRYLRENHPSVELYAADGSHPSLAGSYAAACAFYTMIYKKDPTTITWNSTLPENEANTIKMAAKTIVFDNISTWDFTEALTADFDEEINGAEVSFTNTSSSFDTLLWEFGDGNTSGLRDPVHTYAESGVYTVSLTITKCVKSTTKIKTLNINVLSTEAFHLKPFSVYPNPTSGDLNLQFNKIYKEVNTVISDLSGKTVLTTSTKNTSQLTLDISTLSKGIYILNVIADERFSVEKIVRK